MRTCASARAGLVCAATWAALSWNAAASAQTTVTLDQPKTEVVYATVRGGSYANTNLSTLLATRASDDLQYERRALLKFDTQNTIPSGSAVSSALLTVTVKNGSADASRRIAAYQVKTSWAETEVTWNVRRTSTAWTSAGGDLGSQIAVQTVGNTAGTKVTFDITSLVKAAVSGQLGSSRYTRIALVDLDGSTADSYREYYTPSDSNTSNRPVLKVTYGGTTSTTTTTTTTSSSGTLRVLHWNTHHGGVRTDGVYDPYRLIKYAASYKPDVVSFNEVERYNGKDQPALFLSLMKQYTGQMWYAKYSTGDGAYYGIGNLVLSRYPFVATATNILVYTRAAVDVTVSAGGHTINFTSTHLDNDSTSQRLAQISELVSWEKSLAQQRIIAGDFNAWPGSTENSTMKQTYYDSWAVAKANGTAIAYPGNEEGNTRNSRIDYIYYSHGATGLALKSMQIFDTRDSNGVRPSDHRPILAIYYLR